MLTEVLCKEPESMGGMQVKVSSYQIGSVAVYLCPKGQEMMGKLFVFNSDTHIIHFSSTYVILYV